MSLKASPPLLLHLMEWQALFKEACAKGGVQVSPDTPSSMDISPEYEVSVQRVLPSFS